MWTYYRNPPPNQQALMEFVRHRMARYGEFPSHKDIARNLNWSDAAVQQTLLAVTNKGLIKRVPTHHEDKRRRYSYSLPEIDMLSTADKIRQLLHLPDGIIAQRLKCDTTYIRVVRQRTTPEGFPKRRACDIPHRERYEARRSQQRTA